MTLYYTEDLEEAVEIDVASHLEGRFKYEEGAKTIHIHDTGIDWQERMNHPSLTFPTGLDDRLIVRTVNDWFEAYDGTDEPLEELGLGVQENNVSGLETQEGFLELREGISSVYSDEFYDLKNCI